MIGPLRQPREGLDGEHLRQGLEGEDPAIGIADDGTQGVVGPLPPQAVQDGEESHATQANAMLSGHLADPHKGQALTASLASFFCRSPILSGVQSPHFAISLVSNSSDFA